MKFDLENCALYVAPFLRVVCGDLPMREGTIRNERAMEPLLPDQSKRTSSAGPGYLEETEDVDDIA